MPKLLQINECLNFSTGKIAQSIGEKVIENGWESWIAYSSRQQYVKCKSNVLKVGLFLNPYIHYLESLIFDREGLSSRFATMRLISKIKKIEPDIIHLHNIHDHWLNYKILFEYLNTTNINIVWTFHDCWAFTGHCFHFITKKCERWKEMCMDCPLQNEYPKSLIDRSQNNFLLKKNLFTASNNLVIVACSDWMAKNVRQSFLQDKPLKIIKNGVDLNTFKPNETRAKRAKDEKFQILAVSNVWNKEKGLFDIYKLRGLLPHNEYDMTIVGLSKYQVKNLPKGIKGLTKTKNISELVDLYSSSDVLINPTYADTFPTINIEALACGTPIITYATGGSPEAVDSKTGIIVPKGDIFALSEAIITMKRTPLRNIDCRQRAEMYFNKELNYNRYLHLYNDLLSKHR